MSRVSPVQTSFNGGEISQRLRGRIDQSLYSISMSEMVGWGPLVEGGMEAMPGFIHVAQAAGPCRLLRFEYNTTQGHVIEASEGLFRIYTNDQLIELDGVPVQVASPYSLAQVQELKTHQSFDVMYCFHKDLQVREFFRTSATDFGFAEFETQNGPFDDRNTDQAVRVSSNGLSGNVTLSANSAIFQAGDVGSLFKMEVVDFGDTPAWEPGITVNPGDYRTSLERVYRAISGTKTGSWQPSHTEGVEWDGMSEGQDVNEKDAGGVQWEYIHDRFGICRITGFNTATNVSATVLRTLPFTTSNGNTFDGGYFDPDFPDYVPPGVAYNYGTWRWSFGAFSDSRGWPQAGVIWNERLCLVKDSTIYGSVTGALDDFSEVNEFGEISNDMAFTATLNDPNAIVELAANDKLLLFTAAGCFALGPSSAAQGVGPKNLRIDRQHHSGSSPADSVPLNGRTLTISRCQTRIFESDFDAQRQIETAIDLSRYARHIGRPKFLALAQQQYPLNHIWALRGDGTLACCNYLPSEDVLGFARRELAAGLFARSMVSITDPEGAFEQVWIAAEVDGQYHVMRMAQWRQDGESDDTGVMVDMAHLYDGVAKSDFAFPLLANSRIEIVADGKFVTADTDAQGAFTLEFDAERLVAGLPYPARWTQLIGEGGGDSGPARGKMARISRAFVEVLDSRGLAFGPPGTLQDLHPVSTERSPAGAFVPESGFFHIERAGDQTREPRLAGERNAPTQATIVAVGRIIEVAQK